MAKKKKTRARGKSGGQFEAALHGLGVIEKDVAKVRANLRKFLEQAEKLVSGNEFIIPRAGSGTSSGTSSGTKKKGPKK